MLKWDQVNKRYCEDCPNIMRLVDFILTIPATSAENERGFSLMKQTKTKFRARMSSENLNNRMALSLLTPDVTEYDPTPHVQHWYASSSRRLRDMPMAMTSDEIDDDDWDYVEDDSICEDCEISEVDVEKFIADLDERLTELDHSYK